MLDVLIPVIAVVTVSFLIQRSRDNRTAAQRRRPVVGTPQERNYTETWTQHQEDDGEAPDMHPRENAPEQPMTWTEPEPARQPNAPQRPVLTRNPYAERSEYGASPLSSRQPPKATPLSEMLDRAFMTAEDQIAEKMENRDLPLEDRQQTAPEDLNRELVASSLAKAFPQALKIAGDTRPGIHRPVRVDARGRRNVRQAVIMSEVIARPRAFDL